MSLRCRWVRIGGWKDLDTTWYKVRRCATKNVRRVVSEMDQHTRAREAITFLERILTSRRQILAHLDDRFFIIGCHEIAEQPVDSAAFLVIS